MENNSSYEDDDGRHRKYFSRHTIYGPPDLLPKWLKKSRAMTEDEHEQYSAKVRDTQGFDVDGCEGSLSGRIVPIWPDTIDWEPAEMAAQFAATEKDNGKSVEYKQLVKANIQPIEGMLYYLTFTGVDLADHIEKLYRAKVQLKPGATLHLVFFEQVPNSHEKAKEMRENLAPILAKIAKKRSKMFPEVQEKEVEKTGTVLTFKLTRKDLYINSFYVFVREIKKENPTWKYARVKKVASKKWRSFCRSDKGQYILQAGLEFADKADVIARRMENARGKCLVSDTRNKIPPFDLVDASAISSSDFPRLEQFYPPSPSCSKGRLSRQRRPEKVQAKKRG